MKMSNIIKGDTIKPSLLLEGETPRLLVELQETSFLMILTPPNSPIAGKVA